MLVSISPIRSEANLPIRPAPAADDLLSIFDVFAIGIGPSSSHTVGPMRAAYRFASNFTEGNAPFVPLAIVVELFGSLALTGSGHSTDTATLLGLSGWLPEKINPDNVLALIAEIRRAKVLKLNGSISVSFVESENLLFHRDVFLPAHPNGMRFTAYHPLHQPWSQQYYSIGGGAIVLEGEAKHARDSDIESVALPYPFVCANDLLAIGEAHHLTIAEIMLLNENARREESKTLQFVDDVHMGMLACIERGCQQEGILPGGLKVRRRARALHQDLLRKPDIIDESRVLDWISLYALAVNEENAAGGRVITAPTNGAAGIIPAVMKYYETFCAGASIENVRTYLLTAAAIGTLYKRNASISAAEMGCQGEVGVACSMAAAGLAAALGGSNRQIENAAEIGMEHNLGLTCDPVMGLVQIPCIERNTMGAIKAVTAARLAMRGDGTHIVSLDAVIETMRQTGHDMKSIYKETSLGGLAVNIVEC